VNRTCKYNKHTTISWSFMAFKYGRGNRSNTTHLHHIHSNIKVHL